MASNIKPTPLFLVFYTDQQTYSRTAQSTHPLLENPHHPKKKTERAQKKIIEKKTQRKKREKSHSQRRK